MIDQINKEKISTNERHFDKKCLFVWYNGYGKTNNFLCESDYYAKIYRRYI